MQAPPSLSLVHQMQSYYASMAISHQLVDRATAAVQSNINSQTSLANLFS